MEPTESFSLRWDDFETNTCGALKELRDDSDFCDVTLACDGKQVSAHKVILAGGSKFFKQILKQNPHPHPLLYLKGVRYEYLLSILDFVYTGEANINETELTSFLDVANDLQIKGLIEKNKSRKPSSKESETIPSNASHEDERPAFKKEAEPLLHVNNRGFQSTCQEGPIDTSLDVNIKVELDDTNHSTVSLGMEVNHEGLKDLMDLRPNSSKLAPVFTSPDQLFACQQKPDLPLHQPEISDPYLNCTFKKSNCEENQDNVKTKPSFTSSFHVNYEEDSYIERDGLRCFDGKDLVFSDDDMSVREPVDTDSKREDEKSAHYWYEENEKYKNVSARHDGEQGENHNDQEFSTMKKGRKVSSTSGKSVADNSVLKEHLHPIPDEPFPCLLCPKTFDRSNDLKQHTRTHTGEKPFLCMFCPKAFSKSCNLKEHIRIHTGEKPFLCMFCPKAFATSSQLKAHTRIHTGEKPFQCLVCFKRFTKSSTLNDHKKRGKCSMELGE